MWIKDWWDRMRRLFKKEETVHKTENVMELKPDQAPEPVPDRKTSDEMIEEMAESTLQHVRSMAEETVRAAESDAQCEPETIPETGGPTAPEEQPGAEEAPEPEKQPEDAYEADPPYEPGDSDERDLSDEVTWCEEDDEKKDCVE